MFLALSLILSSSVCSVCAIGLNSAVALGQAYKADWERSKLIGMVTPFKKASKAKEASFSNMYRLT